MGVSIEMGVDQRGAAVDVDMEELLATRLLVQGNSGSGKSHLLRRLLEGSAALVQQVVIDPEGDFVSLGEAFGHLTVDADGYSLPEIRRIAQRVREHRASVVLNLEGLEQEGQMRCAAEFLSALFRCAPGTLVSGTRGRRRSSGLRAGWWGRSDRRGPASEPRSHDEPNVPRPKTRSGRGDRNPAPCQARQECRCGGVQFSDGPDLS